MSLTELDELAQTVEDASTVTLRLGAGSIELALKAKREIVAAIRYYVGAIREGEQRAIHYRNLPE